jgi:hypothetical protein
MFFLAFVEVLTSFGYSQKFLKLCDISKAQGIFVAPAKECKH